MDCYVVYVGTQVGTVPVPELGCSPVPVPALGEFVPVLALGPKMMSSSGIGSCERPSSGTGRPVPELGNDLCTTLTPILAPVPILALVPERGRYACPRSGTSVTSPHFGTGA